MSFDQLANSLTQEGQRESGYISSPVGGNSWQSGLSQSLAGVVPAQAQAPAKPKIDAMGHRTVDAASLNQLLGIERYGDKNPAPMEGMTTGLLNDPYQEAGALEYGKILGNMLAPTQAGLYQMYGDNSMLGKTEANIHKGLNYLPEKAGDLMGGGKFGNFMSTGNPFYLFG